jgi:hypothetical protein
MVFMVDYHLLYELLGSFLFGLGRWSWLLVGRGESSKRRVHSVMSGVFMVIATAQSHFSRWSPVIWSPTILLLNPREEEIGSPHTNKN